jgi:hypothetical protein
VHSYETYQNYNFPFCKRKHLIECDSNGSKSSYRPVLHSYTWIPYSSFPCVCSELSDARVINADGRLFLVIINSICPVQYHAHVTHHTNQTNA